MNAEPDNAVTVALVEDDRRFSQGLVLALRDAPGLRCVGLCPTRAEALAQLPGWRPDVVLLDLDLGTGRDGLDILPELARQLPDTKFLVLTVVDDPTAIFQAAQRGAFGYLRKSVPLAELPAAILEVHAGFHRFSPEVLRLMWNSFRNPPPDSEEKNKLSSREAELLELLAQGYAPKELANHFNLNRETVKTHIRNIHDKLCASTTQLAIQKVYPAKRFSLLPRWIRGGDPI